MMETLKRGKKVVGNHRFTEIKYSIFILFYFWKVLYSQKYLYICTEGHGSAMTDNVPN